MAERKHLTLIYQYNENWIGGTYYIINIIRALKVLPDEERPFLNIIYDLDSNISLVTEIKYPFVNLIAVNLKINILEKILNKIFKTVFGYPLIKKKIYSKGLDNVYPVPETVSVRNIAHFYYWIPDFQEHYLPQFFSKREITNRVKMQKDIVERNAPIVFSSKNALNDFNKFYPNNKNKKKVLNFVSIINTGYKEIPIECLCKKYHIDLPYFIVCNQFWKHKNHEIVFKAVKILKENNVRFKIVLTGKEYDHRDLQHTAKLKSYLNKNDLSSNILFLGFIDRDEQLQLMKNSVAIIQPSLFEGWSTVVEDTKALNHYILVSDIPLHREQINTNCAFFNPADSADLAAAMISVLKGYDLKRVDYNERILSFANEVVNLFD